MRGYLVAFAVSGMLAGTTPAGAQPVEDELVLITPVGKAARAFVELLLSERGQRIAVDRGLFPIVPKYRIEGPPGSTAEMAVEFNGGVRSYYDVDVISVYDDALAQKRYEQVNATFRREIESVAEQLKRK